MRKAKNKKGRFSKIFRVQLVLTGIFVAAYVAFGYFFGWEILLSDMHQKGRVAGTTVSALVKVFGPPDAPILSGSAGCDGQNQPYVYLSWNQEDDATSYDVKRDGVELVGGLLDTYYSDQSVENETEYIYTVTAVGPEGTAESDLLALTTSDCSQSLIPQVSVNTFKGRNIASYHGTPSTTDRKPSFSGSTNIANAVINIEVHSSQIIYASTSANINGFWQWTPPLNLSRETHVIYVTAVDANDPTVTANTSLVFKIKKEEDGDDDEEDDEEISQPAFPPVNVPVSSQEEKAEIFEKKEGGKPFDFEIELGGEEYVQGVEISEEAYRGENLETKIIFNEDVRKFDQAKINYVFLNEDGFLWEAEDSFNFENGLDFKKNIPLSPKLKLGKYKLQISVTIGETTVSHEGYFVLKDRAVLKIGAGMILTYSDILENLGWLVSFSLFLLIILGILSAWEHHLAKRAIFRVTEKLLKKRGFIN